MQSYNFLHIINICMYVLYVDTNMIYFIIFIDMYFVLCKVLVDMNIPRVRIYPTLAPINSDISISIHRMK